MPPFPPQKRLPLSVSAKGVRRAQDNGRLHRRKPGPEKGPAEKKGLRIVVPPAFFCAKVPFREEWVSQLLRAWIAC